MSSVHLVNFSVDIVDGEKDGNFSTWRVTSDVASTLQPHSMVHLFATLVILGTIILLAIIGNVLVMAAVVLERNLRTVANYLVVSLAVADMMVATLVMPLAAVNEVSQRWFLGREICDMWVSLDVICCTSSILHLVAISLDRYWAVTRVDYIHHRSGKRILMMVGASWTLSLMISIPPLFLQKDPSYDPNKTGSCIINQDPGYTIFSTVGAFYLPFIFMMIIYLRVFLAARRRIRKKQFRARAAAAAASATAAASVTKEPATTTCVDGGSTESHSPTEGTSMTTFMLTMNTIDNSPRHSLIDDGGGCMAAVTETDLTPNDDANRNETKCYPHSLTTAALSPPTTPPTLPSRQGHLIQSPLTPRANFRSSFLDLTKHYLDRKREASPKSKEKRAKERMEQKRERKAARTLAVITGSFICCWLPFFILALVGPFCKERCHYPPLLMSIINWLGYFNSLLNPIIYTVFNPDFRSAFHKILFGKYRRRARYQPAISLTH